MKTHTKTLLAASLAVTSSLLMLTAPADAASLTWDGDTNNDWFTGTNWNPDQAPTDTDDLTINSGTPTAAANVLVGTDGSILINGGDVTWSGRFNTTGWAGQTNAVTEITSGSLTVDYNGGSSHAFKVGDNSGSDGTFVQSGGTVTATNQNDWLELAAGNSGAQGTYQISGGTLNAGRLYNGNPGTGLFHIIGDAATINLTGSGGTSYSQNAASTLELDINGISAIDAAADVSLAGTLDVEFLVTPINGQMFTIIDYGGTLSGTFGTFGALVDSPLGADTIGLSIDYGSGSNDLVTLTVVSGGLLVPEPDAIALGSVLGLALVGFGLFRMRRKK